MNNKIRADLRTPLKDLEGNDVPSGEKLNKLAAYALAQQTKGPALKLFELAETLANVGVVELDTSDFNTLRDAIDGAPNLTVLSKGQILRVLTKAQAKADSNKGTEKPATEPASG